MNQQSHMPEQGIAHMVTRGIGWNYLSFGIAKTVSLVTVSVLAHLLTPANFGVVALASLAIEYLSVLNDFGLATALIQRREKIDEASNVVFTLNLTVSISLTLITILIAPLAALYFREPDLTPILRWLGLTFTINALGSVHKARLQRDMKFGRKLIPEIGNNLVKAAVSIGMALAGYGAWSLVYGQLIGLSVSIVLLWVVVPWVPQLLLISSTAKQLFKYGISIMADRALQIFGDSFDYFLIGRYFDTATLGIYTLAYKLPELLIITTLNVLGGVFFPAFSTIQDDPKVLRKSFLSTTRYVQLLVTPMCLGLIVGADPIIRVAFGEQWLDAIPLMQILCLHTLVLSIGYHVGDVYKAIGRPDILIKLAVPIFIIRVLAIWIGAQQGLLGVAFGHLLATSIELILRTIITIRILKVSVIDIFKQMTAFIGGIVLLACTIPVLNVSSHLHPLTRLIMIILAGAIGYLGVIWYIEREALAKLLKITGINLPNMRQGN